MKREFCRVSLAVLTCRRLAVLLLLCSALPRTCHACYMSARDLGVTSASAMTSPPIDEELSALLNAFRLGAVQEKMLSGLGLVSPPRFATIASRASLRRPTTSSNGIRQRQRHPTLPIRQMQTVPGDNRLSRDVVFAEMGRMIGCQMAATNRSRSTSLISFKLPHSAQIIRNATLWFHSSTATSANDTTNKVWLCPCLSNSTSRHPAPNASIAPPEEEPDDGCFSLHDNQPITTTGHDGMSSVPLSGNWRHYLHGSSAGQPPRRLLFRLSGKVRVTSRKRPFLVLELGNETPKRRAPRASTGSRECRPGTQVADVSSPCCRSSFHVNVTELGWQRWIISPLEFDFHFCAGTCEQGGHAGFEVSGTSEMLWSSRGRDPTAALQRARMTCCVPRRVSPLPVIITTDGFKANRTFIPNFQIEECACFGLRR